MTRVWLGAAAAWWIGYTIWLLWPARLAGAGVVSLRRQRGKIVVRLLFIRVIVEGRRTTMGSRPEGAERFVGRTAVGIASAPGDDGAAVCLRVTVRCCRWIRIVRTIPLQRRADDIRGGAALRGNDGRSSDGPPGARTAIWLRFARRCLGALRLFRRHATVERLDGRAVFGTGDAAATGWLAGIFWALAGIGQAALLQALTFSRPPEIRIIPLFGERRLSLSVKGRGTIRQGWLLAMGAMVVWSYAKTWWLEPAWENLNRWIRARRGKGSRVPWTAAEDTRRG